MKLSEHDAARIAVQALCAPSTVRRVLMGTQYSSAYSRTRVLDACRELGFPIPAEAARGAQLTRPGKAPRNPTPERANDEAQAKEA